MNRGYQWIHELKEKLKRKVPDLIALARQNDPFYADSELDWQRARWFAGVWEQLGYKDKTGIHLRRMHYRLGDSKPEKLNGKPYEYSDEDWSYLQICSKAARILGLVPPHQIDDHRNGEPYVAGWSRAEFREPGIVTQETEPYCPLPEIRLNFSPWDLSIESPVVHGYAPDDFQDRSYYIELWIEKSTQDDILVPLCKELGITLVTSVGFQSLSNVVKLLQRVHQRQKPCRVLYVSDYDKSGDSMPVAVARHIEFWLPEYAPGADVKLMLGVDRRAGRFLQTSPG